MTFGKAIAAPVAVAFAAAVAAGPIFSTEAGAQTTAQTKATVANEAGNPINAPETVDPGQQVSVSVPGAGDGARLEIWGPVSEQGGGTQVASAPLTGGSAIVTAPQVSASYELRYVTSGGSTRARRAFEVAAAPVMLTVSTDVSAGATLGVTWRGPAKPGDTFQIFDPTTGTVLQSTPVVGDSGGQNVSNLTVPDHDGMAELRYVAPGGTVLRSIPFEVHRLGG